MDLSYICPCVLVKGLLVRLLISQVSDMGYLDSMESDQVCCMFVYVGGFFRQGDHSMFFLRTEYKFRRKVGLLV